MFLGFENYREIDVLKGKTLVSVDRGHYDSNDALFFKTADGEFYIMTHYQECCENVYIDDICGDFADLLNEEILTAEELNNDYPVDEECIEDTYTWTFYHLATFHGDVSIRWFGTSNGYYSESAEFYKISEEDYNVHVNRNSLWLRKEISARSIISARTAQCLRTRMQMAHPITSPKTSTRSLWAKMRLVRSL